MNPVATIVISAVVAAGAAVVTVKLASNPAPPPGDASAASAVASRVDALDARFQNIEKQVEALRSKPAEAKDLPARVSDRDIEDAVARVLATKAPVVAAAVDGSAVEKGKKGKESKIDLAATVGKLTDRSVSWEDRMKLWKQLEESGLMDKAIEALSARADEAKNNADAQYDLGQAYIAKLQTVSDGPEKGQWAMAADRMFDRALEIDNHHWEARFSKAISLSFWPPIFGKQNDAISQFETLRRQQEESGGSRPEFAQTYHYLGNLYQQQGKADQAAEVYKKGLSLFPNDETLKQKSGQK